MTSPETSVADVAQKTLHDQIRKLAETLMETSNVKLEDVTIYWCDFVGIKSQIQDINIKTSKR
jgi:hypothetical protein